MINRLTILALFHFLACSALPEPPLLRDDIEFLVVLKDLNDSVTDAISLPEPVDLELVAIDEDLPSKTHTVNAVGVVLFKDLHQGVSYQLIMKNPNYNYMQEDTSSAFYQIYIDKIQKEERLNIFLRYCGELSGDIDVNLPGEINHFINPEQDQGEYTFGLSNRSECKIWLRIESSGDLTEEKINTEITLNRGEVEPILFSVRSNNRNEARFDTLKVLFLNNGLSVSDDLWLLSQQPGIPEYYSDIDSVFINPIGSDTTTVMVEFKNIGTGSLELEIVEYDVLQLSPNISIDPEALEMGPNEKRNVNFTFPENRGSEDAHFVIRVKKRVAKKHMIRSLLDRKAEVEIAN